MAKGPNINSKNNTDANPGKFNAESARQKIDPPGPAQKHDEILDKLDRQHGPTKGGR